MGDKRWQDYKMEACATMLGPKIGYSDLLDEAITAKSIEDQKLRAATSPLRPSSAGYCARRLAYDLDEVRNGTKYEREPMKPATTRLLDLGHAIEMHVLKYFQLLKLDIRYRQQILTFFPIESSDLNLPHQILEGSCDFALMGTGGVGDVKSKGSRFSIAYKSTWDEELEKLAAMESIDRITDTLFYADHLPSLISELGDDFLADNLYQVNLYAMAPFMRERGINHGFVLRYEKNSSRLMEIRFRPSEEILEKVRVKFNTINKAVEAKNPESVEKEFWLGSVKCAFCPHKNICWRENDALKEHFKTYPDKRWPKKIEEESALVHLFKAYEAFSKKQDKFDTFREVLISEMVEKGLFKIELPWGHVYELKKLKTPKEHWELRRSKK